MDQEEMEEESSNLNTLMDYSVNEDENKDGMTLEEAI
jgi:hypothetical protein